MKKSYYFHTRITKIEVESEIDNLIDKAKVYVESVEKDKYELIGIVQNCE